MKHYRLLLALPCLLLLTGCPKDDRAKRAASLNRVQVETAKKEYEAAPTPEKKDEVAKEYFETAPALIGVVDDYMQGRKPSGPEDLEPKPKPEEEKKPEPPPASP